MTYQSFIAGKLGTVASAGIDAALRDYKLFPHQADLTRWALRRGRAAIFADTGLGKMRMAIAWADTVATHTGGSRSSFSARWRSRSSSLLRAC